MVLRSALSESSSDSAQPCCLYKCEKYSSWTVSMSSGQQKVHLYMNDAAQDYGKPAASPVRGLAAIAAGICAAECIHGAGQPRSAAELGHATCVLTKGMPLFARLVA